jgi:transcriptional regulator with XRE-family HTH domain
MSGRQRDGIGAQCGAVRVRRAVISSIEHGHANPTQESIDKVASALDVAVADLLG